MKIRTDSLRTHPSSRIATKRFMIRGKGAKMTAGLSESASSLHAEGERLAKERGIPRETSHGFLFSRTSRGKANRRYRILPLRRSQSQGGIAFLFSLGRKTPLLGRCPPITGDA